MFCCASPHPPPRTRSPSATHLPADEIQMHQKLGEIVSALNATRDKRFQLEQDRDLSSEDFPPNVRDVSSSIQPTHARTHALIFV